MLKINLTITLLILIFISNSFAKNESKNSVCRTKADKASAEKIIKENYEKLIKVTDDPDGAERVILEKSQLCSLPLSQFNLSEEILNKLVLNQKFKFWQYKVNHYSEFRSIELESINYKKFALLMGQTEKEIDQFLKPKIKNGLKIQEKTKKSCTQTTSAVKEALGPVRHQDSLGWCYAYSAADLLSFKLGKRISAIDIAINYTKSVKNSNEQYKNKSIEEIEGGYALFGLYTAIRDGVCLESDLPSEDNANQDLKLLFRDLKVFAEKASKLKYGSSEYLKLICNNSYVKTLTLKNEELFNFLLTLKEKEVTTEIQNLSCKNRITLPKLNPVSIYYKSEIFKHIDKQLEKGNPLEFAYHMNILEESDHEYLKKEEDYLHSSLIIERRYNEKKNECEYLVRNSWGRSCNNINSQFECSEGSIWIPKSILYSGILDVTYLK